MTFNGDRMTLLCLISIIGGLTVVDSFISMGYGLDDVKSLCFTNLRGIQWVHNSFAVPGEGDWDCSLLHTTAENESHTFGDHVMWTM